jgi:predicted transcriptional regulator
MRQKSGPESSQRKTRSGTFGARPVDTFQLKRTVSEPQALLPAVSIRRSITPAYLICLYDGKRFKSLRRHLASHGMTPDQYRQKWNLREDYPMVAPDYAATRSVLAKKIGLGQLRKESGTRKSGRTPKAVVEKAES